MRHSLAIIAGERSGDALAGRALSGFNSFGVTGPVLDRAGCESIGAVDDLSVVGLSEGLSVLPQGVRLARRIYSEIKQRQPDAIVTVDSPSFNLRLARILRPLRIPIVHLVSPQVWAWRRHRVNRVARAVDHLISLFPFESALYRHTRLPVTFVGHPSAVAAESPRPEALGIAAGSRRSERSALGPRLRSIARQLQLPIVEAVPPGQTPVIEGAQTVTDVRQLAQLVSVAISASGTATLELAAARVPMVVVYRVSPLTYAAGARLIRVPHLSLPNLVLGRALVPEFIQHIPENDVIHEVERLLRSPQTQRQGFEELAQLLRGQGALQRISDVVASIADRSHGGGWRCRR